MPRVVISACSSVLSDILVRSGTPFFLMSDAKRFLVFRLSSMTKQPVIFLRATKLRHLMQLLDFMYHGKVNEFMGRVEA